MRSRTLIIVVSFIVGAVIGIGGARLGASTSSDLTKVASARGLSGTEAQAALKTFVAPGKYDEYYLMASGGHSGQMAVIGVPSMRLLKIIPVFSPDPWSGYGFGADSGDEVLARGSDPAKSESLTWGDSHHPAISETAGDYDGRFMYINDRANGRLGMVDLRDFKTKQILDIPNIGTSHGGVFATPNTEYVHISSMQPIPLTPSGYAPLSDYKKSYRGVSTFVSVDQKTGKGVLSKSFQIELPPYDQDLADAGKLASDGFAFINSYNTEMATGGNLEGKPSLEGGASANDYDFLHVIDWKKAEKVIAAGKFKVRNGVRMMSLKTAVDEGVLHFVPEPRSPHGVDVSPSGHYLTVAGKLDPHASVYSMDKIKKAIADKNYSGRDPFGVPILKLEDVLEAQVELGAGPLHTQYDNKGNAYTSLFIESAVAKWTLGSDEGVSADKAFKLVEKVPVHYNIGHVVTAEGDTVSPDGKYLVALNKWSVDRYPLVGTLHPQNFQLIDLDSKPMRILADMPIGFGEPHYVQMIKADKIKGALAVYPPNTDPLTMSRSKFATAPGKERIKRAGTNVTVWMTAQRSHYTPDIIRVKKGDDVTLHITNIEQTRDATHGFAIPSYNKQASLDPGEVVTIKFKATRSGSFAYYCTEFCSALHLEMQGWLLVEP
ncbi:MAG: Sec-dependent nitrous-oxide reductase [Actinomycetota bacterium]